jgi:hypothetical protein
MTDDQANMSSKFPGFVSALNGIDWQIALTTTDVSWAGEDGTFVMLTNKLGYGINQFILRNVADAQGYFERLVARGNGGDGNERAMVAAAHAINNRGAYPNNTGFFRANAALAVVILSDEDEDSYGHQIPSLPPDGYEPWTSEDDPASFLETVNGAFPGKSITVNGIIVQPGDASCYMTQINQSGGGGTAWYGNVYADVIRQTGGAMGSICDTSFTGSLASIGQTIRNQLTSFTLSHLPQPGSVSVTLVPVDPTVTWSASGNKIFFNKALSQGTKVEVTYLSL